LKADVCRALCAAPVVALIAALLAGCATRAERNYNQAKTAYLACIREKGAPACQGELAVLNSETTILAAVTRAQVGSAASSAEMMNAGATMMQMGQPQYQQPVNVYVQPSAPAAHMPTGR